MNHLPFLGKRVWITGASRGIGAALAQQFARQGANLLLSAPKCELRDLEITRQACSTPGAHHILTFDLSQPCDVDVAFNNALALVGSIDILVNNAGITHRSEALVTSSDVDRRVMEVNYFGPVRLTKLVATQMRTQGGGQVAVISSILGLISVPQRSAYIAAKHALKGFFEALRTEVASHGIAITIISPGFVKTDISAYALTGDGRQYGHVDPGQQRGMSPHEIARQTVAAIAARKPRLMIAGRERLLVHLSRLSPTLVSLIVRRISVT